MDKQRIKYIDLYKGLGILIMVMAHVDFGPAFYKFSHAFHMPMFFLASGILYNHKIDFGEFVSRKIRTLIVPYFVFGTIQLLLWFVLHRFNIDAVLPHLKSFLYSNTDGNLVGGGMWFLTCLFWADVIFWCIYNCLNQFPLLMGIACVITGALGMVINTFIPYRLPYGIDSSMVAVLIMYIGYFSKMYINKILSLNSVISILALGGGIAIAFINGSINMRTGKYSNILLFLLAMLLISYSLMIISSKIDNKYKENIIVSKIEYWGRNSIVYLCFNQLFISMCWMFTGEMPQLWIRILILAITMICLRLTSNVILKTPLGIIIGKPKQAT